jgi:gluconolactonase
MQTAVYQRPVKVADVPAHEGPVWFADEDALYYTTTPSHRSDGTPVVRIERLLLDGLDVRRREVVVADANAANGMCPTADGDLLVCEQGSRHERACISLLDRRTGRRTTLVDRADGFLLSSPNDVVAGPDGAIWFTDPSYGHLQGFRPPPERRDAVVRIDPRTGAASVVETRFDKPNGIALDPTGAVLYVGDSGANHEPGSYDPSRPHDVTEFRITPGGGLTERRQLAVVSPGFPDGLKVDAAGRLYVSCSSGVQVRSPHGELLDLIPAPGAVNFCLGGADASTLFITTDTAVWAVRLDPAAPLEGIRP